MTKYQIAFLDIDGTLIDSSNHKVNMNDTRIHKKTPSIRSGRQESFLASLPGVTRAVLDLASILGIDSMITSNGQEITLNGKSIYQNWIEQDVVEEIYTSSNQRGIDVFYDTVHGIFSSADRKNLLDRGVGIRFLKPGEYSVESAADTGRQR